ncbi:MAG: proprotein convertase P-domain-containing protein [Thermoanaerobaculia bacterium]
MFKFARAAVSVVVLGMSMVAAQAGAAGFSKAEHVKGAQGLPRGSSPRGTCGTNSLTQSTTQTITAGNSVSCNAGGLHTDNSYWRAFSIAAFPGGFNACEVEFGIEQATGATGSQPVTVNVYSSTGAAFPGGTLVLQGTATVNVADQAATVLSVPLAATIPAGAQMVAEIFTPNGQAAGNSFFIGSNADGESAPSYLSAADCGIATPTTTGTIGFPDMMIVMNVRGSNAGPPAPVVTAESSSLVTESCSPGNNAIDPGELVTVSLCLHNIGALDTAALVATLEATGGVGSPSAPQPYGVVVSAGPPVCNDFTFIAAGSCGGTLTATLDLQDGATNLGTATFDFTLGALGAPTTAVYSTGNIAVAIPDSSSVDVTIPVADTGEVSDVNVSVRLDHTWDGDLLIQLISPDGTIVDLSDSRGGSGDNYGTGANDCSGVHTVFDDSAGTPIGSGTAPFAGSYSPDSPLAAMVGDNVTGNWILRVTDQAGGDTGTIGCVQIEISRRQRVCCLGCVLSLTCPADIAAQAPVGDPGAIVNFDPTIGGTCSSATASCIPPSGSLFPIGNNPVSCTATDATTGTTANCAFNIDVSSGVSIVEVPTASTWGLGALALLLVGAAFLVLRKNG